jgi:hypothetical protein
MPVKNKPETNIITAKAIYIGPTTIFFKHFRIYKINYVNSLSPVVVYNEYFNKVIRFGSTNDNILDSVRKNKKYKRTYSMNKFRKFFVKLNEV